MSDKPSSPVPSPEGAVNNESLNLLLYKELHDFQKEYTAAASRDFLSKMKTGETAKPFLNNDFEIIDPEDSATLAKSMSRDYIADTVGASVGNNVQGSVNSDGSYSAGYSNGKFTLSASNDLGVPLAAPTLELTDQIGKHLAVGIIAGTERQASIKISAVLTGF